MKKVLSPAEKAWVTRKANAAKALKQEACPNCNVTVTLLTGEKMTINGKIAQVRVGKKQIYKV